MARLTLEQIMQMTPGMDQFVQSQGLVPIGQNDDGSIRYGMANDLDMNISPGQFTEEYADPRRLTEFQREQLRDQGVIQLADYGGSDASNWSWINQNSGTNFQSGTDYLNYLYGNQGEQVGDYYVLPDGMTYDQYVNAPLQYNPADTGMMKWMPYILAAVGTAGMAGMLPGTTSIFGGAGAAGAAGGAPAFTGGASGAGIAGAAGGGGTLSGLTAAEMAAIGAGGAGASGALAGGGEFVGGASGGGLSGGGLTGGEFLGGATGGEVAGGATGGALSGAGGTAVAGAAPGATSALGRILGGNATSDDWLSVIGAGGSSLLGVLGSNAQADAYGDVAQQYLGLGAPFREKLLQSYAPGFSMADQPDFQNALDIGAQAAARATSARSGNPLDNPGAYAEMQKYITGSLALPQLNTYRSQLGSFGQLGTNTAGTASMGEASQTGGMYDALGSGLASLTKPKNPYEDLMKGLLGGIKLNTGTSL